MARTPDAAGPFKRLNVTHEMLDQWAIDPAGPVALHSRQKLLPVDGEGGVVHPPTYGGRYNIDTLSDGSRVATLDSVGAQSRRMERLFMRDPFARLVPQVLISSGEGRPTSLLEVGHRLGDRLVRASALRGRVEQAFLRFAQSDDASAIARLGPTSLVFGVWDRDGTGIRAPRVLSAVVRAWNVEVLTRSAVYRPTFPGPEGGEGRKGRRRERVLRGLGRAGGD